MKGSRDLEARALRARLKRDEQEIYIKKTSSVNALAALSPRRPNGQLALPEAFVDPTRVSLKADPYAERPLLDAFREGVSRA